MPNRRPKKEYEMFQRRLVLSDKLLKFRLVSDYLFLNSFKNTHFIKCLSILALFIEKWYLTIDFGAKAKFAFTQREIECKYGAFLQKLQKKGKVA